MFIAVNMKIRERERVVEAEDPSSTFDLPLPESFFLIGKIRNYPFSWCCYEA